MNSRTSREVEKQDIFFDLRRKGNMFFKMNVFMDVVNFLSTLLITFKNHIMIRQLLLLRYLIKVNTGAVCMDKGWFEYGSV